MSLLTEQDGLKSITHKTMNPNNQNGSLASSIGGNSLTNFSSALVGLLKKSQGVTPAKLIEQKNKLLKAKYGRQEQITPEEIRTLSPSQQSAIRSGDVQALTPDIEAIGTEITNRNLQLQRFDSTLNTVRQIGKDMVALQDRQRSQALEAVSFAAAAGQSLSPDDIAYVSQITGHAPNIITSYFDEVKRKTAYDTEINELKKQLLTKQVAGVEEEVEQWSEPYQLGDKVVQKSSTSGQIRTVSSIPTSGVEWSEPFQWGDDIVQQNKKTGKIQKVLDTPDEPESVDEEKRVKAIIKLHPGEWGNAADHIDRELGAGTATKYDDLLKEAFADEGEDNTFHKKVIEAFEARKQFGVSREDALKEATGQYDRAMAEGIINEVYGQEQAGASPQLQNPLNVRQGLIQKAVGGLKDLFTPKPAEAEEPITGQQTPFPQPSVKVATQAQVKSIYQQAFGRQPTAQELKHHATNKTGLDDLMQWSAKRIADAIKQVESGGNYSARGGSGEFGAYQFMPDTWRDWAQRYLGNASAPMTKENQDKVALAKINELLQQGHDAREIALIWNSGTTQEKKGINKYGIAYDTGAYAKKILDKL